MDAALQVYVVSVRIVCVYLHIKVKLEAEQSGTDL